MFYRVVMQGRTMGNADLEEVKRQFVRVTGLSTRVAEQFFAGMPQVIKRQVAQRDAERIAATLRAIGAAATVEREVPGSEETVDGVQEMSTPLNTGPPTIIPGSQPAPAALAAPSRVVRWLRAAREKWPWAAGTAAVVVAGIYLAPYADELTRSLRRAPPPVVAAPARPQVAETVQAPPALNAALLHGPWRCTDQRTGVSQYWNYGADGTLAFYGDVLKDGPAPAAIAANAPTGWKLDGQYLQHTYPQRGPQTYTASELTLARLRYGDDRNLEIQCRRP